MRWFVYFKKRFLKMYSSKFFNLISLAIIVLAIPITVFLVRQQQDVRSRASAALNNQVEAEAANLTAPAVLGSDAGASGGQFVQFGTAVSNPTFQPSAPYYATFYYQWYKNPATDGGYSYWQDAHVDPGSPPNTWFSHYLPDPNPAAFDPAGELYSSNNYNNFKWQVAKMAEAKQEVAIASWFGPGTKEDTAFNNIINSFMGRADNPYPNLRWAMYYEDEGFSDPTVATIVSDLTQIQTNYTQSPYFLKVNGKPVIFVYGDGADAGGMAQRWKDANTQMSNYYYIVLKVYAGFATDPNQPDSWHQYGPATRSGTHAPYSSYVSPGFWLDNAGAVERLTRDATSFETAVQGMVTANVTWKLTETWNEWGEGSSVEPGEKVRFNSTTGKDEPDTSVSSSYAFHNLYIDILNRNLPSLEQGTGVNPNPSSTPSPTATGGATATIVAAGDMVCGTGSTGAACKQMDTSNLITSVNPDAVLILGDNQYEEGTLADFNTFYDPSWGRFKSITRPSVGNHEYLTTNAAGYFDYFNGAGVQNGPAGDRARGYYASDLGAWRLYALNSNCSKAGGCGVGSPQETWLRADLAANPHSCVLAYYHHPLHTSGTRAGESQMQSLFQALYDLGGDVILAGHEHNYERFAPQTLDRTPDPAQGIREFVVGTGGRNFTAFSHLEPNSEARSDNTFGILKMTLKADSYDWQFLPITGSTFTDSGSSTCH